ncbi:MAG: NAD(P)-binding domain-containing protein [Defluviitaleaceae bacterium]|nr:NAD(P)-binding domain-containing protein [Defluviitaleaceae bacterium]
MLGMILVDDRRYLHTKNYLKKKKHVFCETDTMPHILDFMIFPFAGEIDVDMYNAAYFTAVRKDAIIFSGIRNAYLAQMCEENGLDYHVMMDDTSIATKNAVPTSEGVIAHLVRNRESTIADSRVLIIGYGICGRDLARRLKALDADVYALVRNREKEFAATEDGMKTIYLHGLFEYDFDMIINTVPQEVLTQEMVRRLGDSAMLIDIASAPYGFNMELAKSLNEKSALLAGIPGKHALKTSGEILGAYIDAVLKGR